MLTLRDVQRVAIVALVSIRDGEADEFPCGVVWTLKR